MLYELKNTESRAANAENPTGGRSSGGLIGGGHKASPCLQYIAPGSTHTLMSAEGPGVVRHIWMTFPPEYPVLLRSLILRIYWDGQDGPSVEVPVGDFFGIAHAAFRPMISELTSFLNGKGMNSWIPMPFRKSARITVENRSGITVPMLFYQVDFTLGDELPEDTGYLHAQFRRANVQPMHTDFVILDGVKGKGRYLGTVLGVRDAMKIEGGWWGEGEIKMFFDGESTPTICGTGAEDYIGFAWGLGELCTQQSGCPLCDNENGFYSIYRWHTLDPIYFNESIKVTIMQMGYGDEAPAKKALGKDFVRYPAAGSAPDASACYYDRSDDCCAVSYWYQTLPTAPFPALPDDEYLTRDTAPTDGRTRRDDIAAE